MTQQPVEATVNIHSESAPKEEITWHYGVIAEKNGVFAIPTGIRFCWYGSNDSWAKPRFKLGIPTERNKQAETLCPEDGDWFMANLRVALKMPNLRNKQINSASVRELQEEIAEMDAKIASVNALTAGRCRVAIIPENELSVPMAETYRKGLIYALEARIEKAAQQVVVHRERELERERERRRAVSTYFIHSPAMKAVKIGIAGNVTSRLQSLQTGSADRLILLKEISGNRESNFHEQFADCRIAGEWFRESPILAWLQSQ